MKVSYQWLQEFFEDPLPPVEEVENALSMHAFEIDGVDAFEDDWIIDVDVLPNRSSDALSHRGIAKELSAILRKPLKSDPFVAIPEVPTDESVKTCDHATLSIVDPEVCRRSLKRLVVDVKVGESPQWLVDMLAKFEQRSINNVVDITNYITLLLGQPVHAFDFDKLAGEKKEIFIRRGKEGEEIDLLDEEHYTLDSTIPVIADGEKALDVGGIKGGLHTGIDQGTKRVLLSVSSFDPVVVRKASRKLKLRTDASAHFEHDVSQEIAPIAMEHLSAMIADICGGTVAVDVLDEYPRKKEKRETRVSSQNAERLLGTTITDEIMIDVFDRLGFVYKKEGDDFVVEEPAERTDLSIEADYIEEIGRVYGYEHVQSEVTEAQSEALISKRKYYEEKIRASLTAAGFSELITYSLRAKGKVEIQNPLSKERAFMRESLEDGIEESLGLNEKNKPLLGIDRIKVFEIGVVFEKENEHLALGIGVSGKKADGIVSEAVAVLEEVFGVPLHAKVLQGYAEINLDKIFDELPDPDSYDPNSLQATFLQHVPHSVYPFMLRDIAVWVPEGSGAEVIEEVVREKGTDLLERTDLFDEFTKEGRTSYAFHLVFQSHEKTLSDEEVNAIMKEVEDALKEKGFEVR